MTRHAAAKNLAVLGICAATAVCALYVAKSPAQSAQTASDASPIYGVRIPEGYRNWGLISINHLTGASLNMSPGAKAMMAGALRQLRAQLGNDIAIKAFQEGKRPFPDGAIIAALHFTEVTSDANNKVLAGGFPDAGLDSSVVGTAVNVQFMVKDSKKFADFRNGKPGDEALHNTCFPCHQAAADRDYVFARYAPTP